MSTKAAVNYIMRNTEYHHFIKWLIGYDKTEWTTSDLKADYPAYNPKTIPRMLRKLWKFDVIRRDKRVIVPTAANPRQPYALWRLNMNCLDNIKRAIEKST